MNATFTEADVARAIEQAACLTTVATPHIVFEEEPVIFAMIKGCPGSYAVAHYRWPVKSTPKHVMNDWFRSGDENLPTYRELNLDGTPFDNLVLPTLDADAAQDVLLHSHYSGADLLVTAIVRAHRGEDAMFDFADTQNVYSMPGAPEVPADKMMWLGSGL